MPKGKYVKRAPRSRSYIVRDPTLDEFERCPLSNNGILVEVELVANSRRYLISHYSEHRFKPIDGTNGFVKAGYVQVHGRGTEEGNFLQVEEFFEEITGGSHDDFPIRVIDWSRFSGDPHLLRNIFNVGKIDKKRLLGFIRRYQDEFEDVRVTKVSFDATDDQIDKWEVAREKLFTYAIGAGGKIDIHTVVPAYPVLSGKKPVS